MLVSMICDACCIDSDVICSSMGHGLVHCMYDILVSRLHYIRCFMAVVKSVHLDLGECILEPVH